MFFLAGTIRVWYSGYTASSIFQLAFNTPPQNAQPFAGTEPSVSVKQTLLRSKGLFFHWSPCSPTVSVLGILSAVRDTVDLKDVIFQFVLALFVVFTALILKVDRHCLASPGKIHYEGVRNRHLHRLTVPSLMHPPWRVPCFSPILLWLVSQTLTEARTFCKDAIKISKFSKLVFRGHHYYELFFLIQVNYSAE